MAKRNPRSFFRLSLELREQIYENFLDVRVNFIFKSRVFIEDHKACDTNSLDEEYSHELDSVAGTRDDSDEDDCDSDDDPGKPCPLGYQVSPLPCNTLVNKQFFNEANLVYKKLCARTVTVLDDSIVGNSRWSKRFKPESELGEDILRLCERGRFIFDSLTEDTFKMFDHLPPAVRDRVRSLFLTTYNFGCDDAPTQEAWSKEDNEKPTSFGRRIDKRFKSLEKLAISFDHEDFYAMWAPIDAFTMLQNGRIKSLELVHRAILPNDESEFPGWGYLTHYEMPEHTEGSSSEERMDEVDKWVEWEEAEQARIEKEYPVKRLTFAERHDRGIYKSDLQYAAKQEEGTVWLVEQKANTNNNS